MQKKWKVLGLVALILVVLAGLYCMVVLPFQGSILRKMAWNTQVRAYVEDAYGPGYTVEWPVYNGKGNYYVSYVQSDTSPDTRFSITDGGENGALTDHYDWEVTQRENTLSRLSRQLDEKMELDYLPAFPMECCMYALQFDKNALDLQPDLVRERIALDMPLDMTQPPLPLIMTLWVVQEDPSWEALAAALRQAADTADALGWPVAQFSISLHTPIVEGNEKPADNATEFRANDVPYDVVRGENLVQYLVEHIAVPA